MKHELTYEQKKFLPPVVQRILLSDMREEWLKLQKIIDSCNLNATYFEDKKEIEKFKKAARRMDDMKEEIVRGEKIGQKVGIL